MQVKQTYLHTNHSKSLFQVMQIFKGVLVWGKATDATLEVHSAEEFLLK